MSRAKRGEVTIQQIAEALKVATSTVSRALNNHPKISLETKQRVFEKATQMGYAVEKKMDEPNKQKSRMIGVIIPSISRYYFAKAVEGIDQKLSEKGYKLILCQTHDQLYKERQYTNELIEAHVEGIITCLSVESAFADHFMPLLRNKIPLVCFDRVNFSLPSTRVVIDNYDAAFKATEHLINTGCKRIAHFGGPVGSRVFDQRRKGFIDALIKNKMELKESLILATDLSESDVSDAYRLWMNLDAKPDAILTANSSSGLSFIHFAEKDGIKVPQDLSIITFGSHPSHDFMNPTVSSIDEPAIELGKTAAEVIINQLEGLTPINEDKTIIKPYQLLIKNSSYHRKQL